MKSRVVAGIWISNPGFRLSSLTSVVYCIRVSSEGKCTDSSVGK
jgi:hypothetical protein